MNFTNSEACVEDKLLHIYTASWNVRHEMYKQYVDSKPTLIETGSNGIFFLLASLRAFEMKTS